MTETKISNEDAEDEHHNLTESAQADPIAPVNDVSPVAPATETGHVAGWRDRLVERSYSFKFLTIGTLSVLAFGLIIGGVLGIVLRPAVETSSEYEALATQNSQTEDELSNTQSDLNSANDHIKEISAREAALEAGEAQLKTDQAALDEKTKQVVQNQFGDGIHLVGTNLAPGVYAINNTTGCYYSWKTGTGSDADIIDNNIVSGPVTVTLNGGDVFETRRCGTWTKVG